VTAEFEDSPVGESTAKRIHVFASDCVPLAGWQIITELRRAGHRVSFSMQDKDRIALSLGEEEIWASEHYDEPEIVLNRLQPDIAMYCNVNTFRAVARFAREVIHILALYGSVELEDLLLRAEDCGALVEKLRQIDYVVTASEQQKYFWSAYCTLAGFSLREVNNRCVRSLVELLAGPVTKRSRAVGVARRGPASRAPRRSLGRVLAISAHWGSLLELRVSNPLRALYRQEHIAGMTISDTLFHELKDDRSEYEAILVQRSVPEFIVDTLQTLALPFVLECDDNILARATYREYGTDPPIVLGLRHCSVLTVPNPRLVRLLEKYSGTRLMEKAFVTPNALPFPVTPRSTSSQPSQIIWIQSDIAALDKNRDAVVRAVDDFSVRHGLPVVLIGPNVLRGPKFKNEVIMGEIDFAANLRLLERGPLSIGVAPLETDSDEETLDFIAGKSDLKILLFAGYGHAGVYSNSPPYSDSSLQDGLSVIGNSYDEWTEALEYQYRDGWKKMPEIAARLQTERHIDAVARESWRPALEACTLSKPVTGADLYEAFSAAMQVAATANGPMGYILANWDVARKYLTYEGNTALAHFSQFGQQERRHARYTLEVHREFLQRVEAESAACFTRAQELIRKRDTLIHSLNIESAAERQSFRAEIDKLEAIIGNLQRELAAAHAAVAGMADSPSWKLTAPLRKVKGLFKRP
jgi:hypothetical protein